MSTVKKIIIIAILTIVAATAVFVAFNIVNNNNNPERQLALAYKYLEEGNYDEAIIAFNKVIGIDEKNIEARIGLSKVYVKTEEYDKAEDVLNEALEIDNKNQTVYEELIGVYELTENYDRISDLIKDLEGIGLTAEADKLRPSAPNASLQSGEYSQPIEVTLSGNGSIYYTVDGSEPSVNSLKYQDKIELKLEGTHHIKTMMVDNRGVESKIKTYSYTLKFESIKNPIANLNSGSYSSSQTVKLSNPNNIGTIYYSIDGKEPYKKYTSAIKINSTATLKARIVDENTNRKSEIASWKYEIKQQEVAPTQQSNSSPFVGVTIQSGTGYTMKRFFTDLFGFDVELSDMRGVGIQIDESAWTKEVSQSEWNSWLQWRKEKYGY